MIINLDYDDQLDHLTISHPLYNSAQKILALHSGTENFWHEISRGRHVSSFSAQDMQITLTFTRCHVSKMYSKTESRSNQKQKEGGLNGRWRYNLRYVVVKLPASKETSLHHYWIFFLIILKEFIVSQPLFRISLQKQPALKLLKTLGNFTFMLVL